MIYPLATPLWVRSREEGEAKTALGRALARESAHREERDSSARAVEDAGRRWWEELTRDAQGGCAAEGFRARARFAGRLRTEAVLLSQQLRTREGRLAAAEEEVDDLRRQLAAARAARGALERHREDWLASRARARQRKEQDALDDALSGRRAEP